MKATGAVIIALGVLSGCASSPKGGDSSPDQERGFRLSVESGELTVPQGESRTVVVTLDRDRFFTQDVKIKAHDVQGVDIEPDSFTVETIDPPKVEFKVSAGKTTFPATYNIQVEGLPDEGRPTWTEIPVKVIPHSEFANK